MGCRMMVSRTGLFGALVLLCTLAACPGAEFDESLYGIEWEMAPEDDIPIVLKDLIGTWRWMQDYGDYRGAFTLEMKDDTLTGSLESPVERVHADEISEVTLRENVLTFVRRGECGDEVWSGTVTRNDEGLRVEGTYRKRGGTSESRFVAVLSLARDEEMERAAE